MLSAQACLAPAILPHRADAELVWPREAKSGAVVLEGRTLAATVAGIKAREHTVQVGGDWSEGRLDACAVERTPVGTIIRAAANPRGMRGYAVTR
jgi:gamma-glutamyltranspeptidase/glutathione hydrolase